MTDIPFYDKTKEKLYIIYHETHRELSLEDVITQVNIGLGGEFYLGVHQIDNPYHPEVLVNKYNQLPQDFTPKDLEIIKPCFNDGKLLLRHDTRIAFEKMCEGALEEGILLKAISTFRSFEYQNKVYYKNIAPEQSLEEYKVVRDRVSARAGHSEHQTGLAVDINDLEPSFENTAEGIWLATNAFRYGFILRYPKGKERITGYDYEPWHFRYLGLILAKKVYQSGLTYDEFYARFLQKNENDVIST